jgi:hypothetical protein
MSETAWLTEIIQNAENQRRQLPDWLQTSSELQSRSAERNESTPAPPQQEEGRE